MSRIRWDAPQARPVRGLMPMLVNARETARYVRFLGPIVGVYTHWCGRTVPCLNDACPHCTNGQANRWTGYAPGLVYVPNFDDSATQKFRWEKAVICVPETSLDALPEMPKLSCLIFELKRERRGSHWHARFKATEKPVPATDVPPFDVALAMEGYWRVGKKRPPEPVTHEVPYDDEPEDGLPATIPFPKGAA
jgi:hypothetical protein